MNALPLPAGLAEVRTRVPLVVDLDGTLIRSDLLVEGGFAFLASQPLAFVEMVRLLWRGKSALKAGIARTIRPDPATLPYDAAVLDLIAAAQHEGRRVFLASASDEAHVSAIAIHLRLDGWFASDGGVNLAGKAKAERLVAAFGAQGFDYVGDSRADLDVWPQARRAIAVAPSAPVAQSLRQSHPEATILAGAPTGKYWLKLLRPHQWAKNGLVFVPLLTAHRFDAGSLISAFAAFIAFSIAASSVYILNDLIDIEADRHHPTKRLRPLAAGRVPILKAAMLAPILALMAAGIAAAVSIDVLGLLLGYLALTTAYSVYLKRKMLADTIALAGLYTLRVLTGAAAVMVPVSEWLLGFSMMIFTALALIKRYIELTARLDGDLPDPSNRNYRKADLPVIAALAAAAAFNAVTVFALYVSSDAVQHLYRTPKLLWLICPVLMYWLGRALLLAHRRQMEDDPIAFALKDRVSLVAGLVIGGILLAAM